MITYNTPKPCIIGTLKHHPYKRIPDTNPPQYTKAHYEFVPTEKKGLLWGFGQEATMSGGEADFGIQGLIELPDGTFITEPAACIRLETPTEVPIHLPIL